MEIQGKIWKEGKWWIAEVPSFDFSTQGKTRAKALEMVRSATLELMECYFGKEEFDIDIKDHKNHTFGIVATDIILSFILQRQRERLGLFTGK